MLGIIRLQRRTTTQYCFCHRGSIQFKENLEWQNKESYEKKVPLTVKHQVLQRAGRVHIYEE